jgi:hypothetical protein
LLAAQNENFQLEKKLHELQISLQNPRSSEIGNGPASLGLSSGSSAPATPQVVKKYMEMKYGEKGSTSNLLATGTNNPSLSMHNNASNFDVGQSSPSSLPVRNGALPAKGPPSTVPPPNVTRGSTAFNLRNKLPNSIQNTITNTSQSLQSKLPASLQKLPASFTQGPTMNMLASKFQNAFS